MVPPDLLCPDCLCCDRPLGECKGKGGGTPVLRSSSSVKVLTSQSRAGAGGAKLSVDLLKDSVTLTPFALTFD